MGFSAATLTDFYLLVTVKFIYSEKATKYMNFNIFPHVRADGSGKGVREIRAFAVCTNFEISIYTTDVNKNRNLPLSNRALEFIELRKKNF